MKKRIGIAVGLISALMGAQATFPQADSRSDGEDRAALEAVNAEYRVEVTSRGVSCCPRTTEVEVDRRDGIETRREMALSGRMDSVDRIRLGGDHRIVVEGTLPGGGESLLIGDLQTLQQEEWIWAFGTSFSPSGRFLAYATHFPRGAVPVEARRSIFLLYDLDRPPEENRSGPRSDWPESNAGWPIFPEENATEPSWNVLADPGEYILMSPFLWTEDERRIVFLVAKDPRSSGGPTCLVVRVNLDARWKARTVVQEPLSPENVDLSGRTVPLDHLLERPLCVRTEELRWAVEGQYGEIVATTNAVQQLGPKVTIQVP